MLLLQLSWAFYWCTRKEGYYVDEEYTYLLSNSYFDPFLEDSPNYMNSWHDRSFWHNALTVQMGERLEFDSVAYNQGEDVHPPLYYYIIHTLSSLKTDFFSKWIGLIPNLFFFAVTMIFTYLTAKEILTKPLYAMLVSSLFGFSVGAVADVLYIRMYMMLTMWIMISFWAHVRALKAIWEGDEERRRRCQKYMWIVTLAGLLTQYYFLIIQALLSAVFLAMQVPQKQWKKMLDYITAEASSVAVYLLMWPKFFEHVLGRGRGGNTYRAAEAYHNITNVEAIGGRISHFLQKVNAELFGGFGVWVLAAAFVLTAAVVRYAVIKKEKGHGRKERKKTGGLILLLLVPALIYILLVSVLVPEFAIYDGCIGTRYFWPVYPMAAIGIGAWIIEGIKRIGGVYKTGIAAGMMAVILGLSLWGEYSVENAHDVLLYEGYNDIKARLDEENNPAIYLTTGDYTYVYQLTLLTSHPQTICMPKEDFVSFIQNDLAADGTLDQTYTVYLGLCYDTTVPMEETAAMFAEAGVDNWEYVGYSGGNIYEIHP